MEQRKLQNPIPKKDVKENRDQSSPPSPKLDAAKQGFKGSGRPEGAAANLYYKQFEQKETNASSSASDAIATQSEEQQFLDAFAKDFVEKVLKQKPMSEADKSTIKNAYNLLINDKNMGQGDFSKVVNKLEWLHKEISHSHLMKQTLRLTNDKLRNTMFTMIGANPHIAKNYPGGELEYLQSHTNQNIIQYKMYKKALTDAQSAWSRAKEDGNIDKFLKAWHMSNDQESIQTVENNFGRLAKLFQKNPQEFPLGEEELLDMSDALESLQAFENNLNTLENNLNTLEKDLQNELEKGNKIARRPQAERAVHDLQKIAEMVMKGQTEGWLQFTDQNRPFVVEPVNSAADKTTMDSTTQPDQVYVHLGRSASGIMAQEMIQTVFEDNFTPFDFNNKFEKGDVFALKNKDNGKWSSVGLIEETQDRGEQRTITKIRLLTPDGEQVVPCRPEDLINHRHTDVEYYREKAPVSSEVNTPLDFPLHDGDRRLDYRDQEAIHKLLQANKAEKPIQPGDGMFIKNKNRVYVGCLRVDEVNKEGRVTRGSLIDKDNKPYYSIENVGDFLKQVFPGDCSLHYYRKPPEVTRESEQNLLREQGLEGKVEIVTNPRPETDRFGYLFLYGEGKFDKDQKKIKEHLQKFYTRIVENDQRPGDRRLYIKDGKYTGGDWIEEMNEKTKEITKTSALWQDGGCIHTHHPDVRRAQFGNIEFYRSKNVLDDLVEIGGNIADLDRVDVHFFGDIHYKKPLDVLTTDEAMQKRLSIETGRPNCINYILEEGVESGEQIGTTEMIGETPFVRIGWDNMKEHKLHLELFAELKELSKQIQDAEDKDVRRLYDNYVQVEKKIVDKTIVRNTSLTNTIDSVKTRHPNAKILAFAGDAHLSDKILAQRKPWYNEPLLEKTLIQDLSKYKYKMYISRHNLAREIEKD